MEKKTKLITIDFDEYIGLTAIQTNFEREVLMRLKKELNSFGYLFGSYREYSKSEIERCLNKIVNVIDNKIIELDKRGK